MLEPNTLNNLLIETVAEHNVIPLGSRCNLNCVFCSNVQNPQNLQVYSRPNLTIDDVKVLLDFVDPTCKIIIGESATRINEGEPFANPQIREILKVIRDRFPKTSIQITTNGSLLTKSLVNFLHTLEPVELNVSVNSLTPHGRSLLMGNNAAHDFEQVLQSLAEQGIAYNGSTVWIPQLISEHDLEDMVQKLEYYSAQSFKVFLPGYTTWTADEQVKISKDQELMMRAYVSKLNYSLDMPVLMEPPKINDLHCVVEGILPQGPARRVGLQTGDQIVRIDAASIISRVHGFMTLKSRENPSITVLRNGDTFCTILEKYSGETPGIAVSYDISLQLINDLIRKIDESLNFPGNTLIFTSELGYNTIKLALKKIIEKGDEERKAKIENDIFVIPVENIFFGGNIKCSGLLTVSDFRHKLKQLSVDSGDHDEFTIKDVNTNILLPPNVFDRGRDLVGEHYSALEEEFSVTVIL